jgi:hypothetical protein
MVCLFHVRCRIRNDNPCIAVDFHAMITVHSEDLKSTVKDKRCPGGMGSVKTSGAGRP